MIHNQAVQAAARLSQYLTKTPLIFSRVLSELTRKKVYLKLETQQPTGSFKVRPAFNGILVHLEEARNKGVLTTSSGNYAQAVAYAARELGVSAAIVMTDDTAPFKVARTRALGGEVIFCGTTFESRFETLDRVRKERGSLVLHGFDSEETITGNGTIALELMEDLPGDFAVFSPASGGGLISGIAGTLKGVRKGSEVYGFQSEKGCAIVRSLEKGERVNVGKIVSIADALIASMPGERTFPLIQKAVDRFSTVSEAEIVAAMRLLFEEQKLVIEAGGAVSVAGLLSGKIQSQAETTVCVLSGGNIEINRLHELLGNL